MISWRGYESEIYEWDALVDILNKEIAASIKLEEMFFNSRSKNRERYFVLPKPLVTKHTK